ncbi:MAG: hypothetical protein HPY57_12860 [Ignavibacteria bacterium]|nr:hypothetical protein [Ignavibacteria bacterium]
MGTVFDTILGKLRSDELSSSLNNRLSTLEDKVNAAINTDYSVIWPLEAESPDDVCRLYITVSNTTTLTISDGNFYSGFNKSSPTTTVTLNTGSTVVYFGLDLGKTSGYIQVSSRMNVIKIGDVNEVGIFHYGSGPKITINLSELSQLTTLVSTSRFVTFVGTPSKITYGLVYNAVWNDSYGKVQYKQANVINVLNPTTNITDPLYLNFKGTIKTIGLTFNYTKDNIQFDNVTSTFIDNVNTEISVRVSSLQKVGVIILETNNSTQYLDKISYPTLQSTRTTSSTYFQFINLSNQTQSISLINSLSANFDVVECSNLSSTSKVFTPGVIKGHDNCTYLAGIYCVSSGDGSGIATFRVTTNSAITITAEGNVRFCSSDGSNETTTANLISGANTLYFKCISGAGYIYIQKNVVTQLGTTSASFVDIPENSPNVYVNVAEFKNLTTFRENFPVGYIYVYGDMPSGVTYWYLSGDNIYWTYNGAPPSGVTYWYLFGNNIYWTYIGAPPSGVTTWSLAGNNIYWTYIGAPPSGVTTWFLFGNNIYWTSTEHLRVG